MPEPAFPHDPFAGQGPSVEEGNGHGRTPVPLPTPPPSVSSATPRDAVPGGGRRTVAVRGDLDLDAAQRIRSELYVALSHAARGIDLDLSDVEFCDCSGLNLLLSLRQQAVKQGKTVAIATTSPAVERLFDLTGTRGLFTPAAQAEALNTASAPSDGAKPHTESEQNLHTVVAQLRRAMQTRPTIDLARGILMSSFNLSPEAAWEVLVTASQNTNTKLHLLAEDVVGTVQGGALSDAVRKQMEAAIAKVNTAASTPSTTASPDPPAPAADPPPATEHVARPVVTGHTRRLSPADPRSV
ncbi:anti-sigma factor antagonist [Streptomyces sp. NPDC058308]|uniref:anti-sigma factor antagonist n=1 Tax=Streptomyces sp. NPDC058308 TaxID=3346440 RepID=UPI0036E81AAD